MIEVRALQKYYKGVQALNNINLVFKENGFVIVLGKSGSGKSTLLNILGGLDNFDSGDLLVFGQKIKKRDIDKYRNSYVGFVFQEYYLIEDLTVGKNISLALELQGYQKANIENKVNEILKQVNLEGYNNHYPKELSGGEKQRIAIARALTKDPKIILADEPTGNLDSKTGKVILEMLKELSKTRLVIMVTHNIEDANEYADRIITIKDGQVIDDYENNKTFTVYEGNSEIQSVILLKKGSNITEENIEYINNIIQHQDKELFLTLCDRQYVVDEIPVDIKKDQYSINNVSENNNRLFFYKTALPLKNAISLAFNSIFIRKKRLFLIMLLFVFSLLFVGIANNISFFNTAKFTTLTFQKSNTTKIPLIQFTSDKNSVKKITFTEENLNNYIDKYPDIKFSANYFHTILFEELVPTYQQTSEVFYGAQKFDFLQIYDSSLPLTLLYGTYPQDNEILITDYMAQMLLQYEVFQEVDDLNELIGINFIYNNNTLTIKGIVKTNYENNLLFSETMYVNKDTYKRVFTNDSSRVDYMSIIVYLGNNQNENYQLFKDINNTKDKVIKHSTEYSYTIYNTENLILRYEKILIGVSIIFIAFASMLIFNFLSSSIVDRQKEIGTLRALGASGKDIYKIFILEGLFIAIIAYFITLILLYITINILNTAICTIYDTPLILFYWDFINIFILLIISLIITLISSVVSLKRYINNKPINVIKNLC